MPAKCVRCGAEATRHVLSLIDDDPDSMEQGIHLDDVELWLCGECAAEVADMLGEEFLGLIQSKLQKGP